MKRPAAPGLESKEVFTTGQVAKICNVTIRTVIKWFESGKLAGYKIPESKDRRIPKTALLRFLREHNVPFDMRRFDPRPKLLIADDQVVVRESLRDFFERRKDLDVYTASNGYEAGYMTAQLRPTVLLIDYDLGDTTARDVVHTLKREQSLSATQVIVMTGLPLSEAEFDELAAETGFRVFRKPLDFEAIGREVGALMGE